MLWLIVPAYNEETRLGETIQQYRGVLSTDDRLVIVVNGSTDGTEELARRAGAVDDRVAVIVHDEKGKGRALLAGYRFVHGRAAAGDVVCYTDADAAVTGDEIVRFSRGVSPRELRVGSRWHDVTTQLRRQPILRQVASRVFNRCVRSATGLPVADTQCPAKALRAECLEDVIGRLDSAGFAFDVDLILSARSAGLAIAEVPVVWSDQAGSTVSMRRAAPAMIKELMRLRRKYRVPRSARARAFPTEEISTIPPSEEAEVITGMARVEPPRVRLDGGVAASEVSAGDIEPRRDHPPRVLSGPQKAVFLALSALTLAGLLSERIPTLIAVSAVFTAFFAAANLVKIELIRRGSRHRREGVPDREAPIRLPDDQLPVYTILLPLYGEDTILQQLIDGIEALDYPKSKLDVKLLLEQEDRTTRDAADALTLPPYFDTVVIPPGNPQGKPRACNVGLARAKGDYLVIYDAEDRPERDQLRKAVRAFAMASENVVCLQAKLNYFNRTHNLLTRWFTAEYSLWFDQLLPGLQAMDVAIPLGGTSNHFLTARLKQLKGWDAFNVTEDADLGIRIFVNGWKTAILDSTTYEEATSRSHNWIRQRSRWIKGYMQTYLRHMRHPQKTYQRMGPRAFAMLQLFFGAATVCVLANPFYWLLTVVWFAEHYHLVQVLFPRALLYVGLIGLFLGNAAFILAAVSGAYGRRNYDDVKWALLTPVYWLLMSLAAWKALIQLFYKPFYWEKTVHGYCMYAPELAEAAGRADA